MGRSHAQRLEVWIAKLRRGKRIPGNLSQVVRRYIQPYVDEQSVVLEIGAGGGRWTQFLTAARELHLVEHNPQIRRVLKDGGTAVIHHADRTKRFFRDMDERELEAFSKIDRITMEGVLARHGLRVREHYTRLLNHTNIVILGK